MKISQSQLKKIIAEEVKKHMTLNEMSSNTEKLKAAIDATCDDWLSYGAPEGTDRDVWARQVEAACKDLHAKVDEILRDLYSGKYDS